MNIVGFIGIATAVAYSFWRYYNNSQDTDEDNETKDNETKDKHTKDKHTKDKGTQDKDAQDKDIREDGSISSSEKTDVIVSDHRERLISLLKSLLSCQKVMSELIKDSTKLVIEKDYE